VVGVTVPGKRVTVSSNVAPPMTVPARPDTVIAANAAAMAILFNVGTSWNIGLETPLLWREPGR
jgi:hypothetical protein